MTTYEQLLSARLYDAERARQGAINRIVQLAKDGRLAAADADELLAILQVEVPA